MRETPDSASQKERVPKVSGGITESRQVYALAAAAGIGTLVGTTQELSIGTAAQLHLATAMPNLTHPGMANPPRVHLPLHSVDGHRLAALIARKPADRRDACT